MADAQANTIPLAPESEVVHPVRRVVRWAGFGLLVLAMLWVAILMFVNGDLVFAVGMTFLVGLICWVYLNPAVYVGRYVFPGLAAIGIFTVFPLLYSVYISFTNYGDGHMMTFERATNHHLARTYVGDGGVYDFALYPSEDDHYQLVFQRDDQTFASTSTSLDAAVHPAGLDLTAELIDPEALGSPLSLRDVLANRSALQQTTVTLPEGTQLRYSGPREFGALTALYRPSDDDPHVLINQQTGDTLTADFDRGVYVNEEGRRVSPGFTTHIGFGNYVRIFTDDGMLAPFFSIFLWTVVFALITVVVAYGLGLTLASLMNWKLIKGSMVYRVLMILPYAVPAFISIQIFRGLFNQNFGEINLLLDMMFGISPEWFSDVALARTMVLITNIWLGYPYMMILALGMLQAIPDDLYEAAHIEGSGVLNNFFRITLPIITKPLTPLLIAAFAFNFNNLVIIELLTGGGPNIVGSDPIAGSTDLLVNYAWRLAFGDGSQAFGLAAAITTLIFLLVAGLSLFYIRYAKVDVAR